jgi:hypothetical protein
VLALRADRDLGLPIQVKVRRIEALACASLPTVVGQGGTDQADAVVLLTADQQVSIS